MRAKTNIQHSNSGRFAHGFDSESAARSTGESIEAKESEQPVSTQRTEFIDAKAAAIWLGIPLRSLYQYVQKGFLPSYKLGRHRLFRKKELLSALSINRLASRDEVLR